MAPRMTAILKPRRTKPAMACCNLLAMHGIRWSWHPNFRDGKHYLAWRVCTYEHWFMMPSPQSSTRDLEPVWKPYSRCQCTANRTRREVLFGFDGHDSVDMLRAKIAQMIGGRA